MYVVLVIPLHILLASAGNGYIGTLEKGRLCLYIPCLLEVKDVR